MSFDLESFIYLDRYCNEGTRAYSELSEYTEAEQGFRHNTVNKGFDLPRFALPRADMNLYTANPSPELHHLYVGDDELVFPVHPQTLAGAAGDPYLRMTRERGRRLDPVHALPSSSTRTLYLDRAVPPHAVKLHFPFRISRYGRRMRDEVVEQAVAVSLELEKGIDRLDTDFAFMRETIGITHRNQDPTDPRGEHWGFLVRDLEPFPRSGNPGRLIPGFALYGRDRLNPDRRFLISDMIGDADPVEFVLENILFPVVRHWVGCYLAFGFFLEPHGQNLLLETDKDMKVRRLVHRDLSVGIDMHRRSVLGLSSDHLNAYNRMEDGKFGSIAYDKFTGHHFFDFLIACLCGHYPRLCPEDFTRPCKALFEDLFPDHREFLPPTQHYFTRQRDAFGKPMYEDLGTPPKWRP